MRARDEKGPQLRDTPEHSIDRGGSNGHCYFLLLSHIGI
jgi:hypothetical protein